MKEKIEVVTDSGSMISKAEAERLGVEVVPLWIHFREESYNDRQITAKDVKRIFEEKGKRVYPSTSSPSPGEFQVVYDERLDLGAEQIISIHIARGIRKGTFNAATVAAKEVQQKHELPEGAINVFDSKQVALSTGFLVREAVNLIASGKNLQAVTEQLEDVRARLRTIGTFRDLKWARKTSPVPPLLLTFFQNAILSPLKLSPLIQIVNGEWTKWPIATPKKPLAMKRLAEIVLASGKFERAGIFHFDAQEEAEKLAFYIERDVGYKPEIAEVPATLAAGAGPGAYGICILEK